MFRHNAQLSTLKIGKVQHGILVLLASQIIPGDYQKLTGAGSNNDLKNPKERYW